MDRGLKERLVGAAVLVALGVWLIPWVLDGPGQTTRTDSEALELPASTVAAPLRFQTITLDNDREPPTPAVGTTEDNHAASGGTPTREPARDTAAVPIHLSSTPSAGAEAVWFVQVGSYAEEENARRQADRVSTYGFETHVSTYIGGGRSMHRVRIGPQASRERAEAAASTLSAHGFVAQVVVEE